LNQNNIDIKDYSEKYLKEHGKALSFERVLAEARKTQVLSSLNRYKHEHVLEVGCGLAPLFLYCDYGSYTIVEPGDRFVQRAKELAAGKGNIGIIHGYMEESCEKLCELGHGFDFIILSSLLHEVPFPNKLLQSVYQVCSSDTVVHINVPNVYSFHRLLAYEMGYIASIFEKSETEAKFQRHTRFDKQLLCEMVEENGFRILSYGTYFIKPFTNQQMEAIMAQNIVDKDIIKGLERMVRYMPDLGSEMYVEVKRDIPVSSQSSR
jgi:SAM-dependent methyltransferase